MATIFGHMAVAVASARSIDAKHEQPKKLILFLCALLSVIPDFDVIAFKFGIPYSHEWGHRGATHSIAFALFTSLIFFIGMYLYSKKQRKKLSLWLFPVFLFSIFSHTLLDMLTNGGLGCAIFWPLEHSRHFFPITPIPVSPIGIAPSLIYVMAWEFFLIFPITALSYLYRGSFRTKTKLVMSLFYFLILIGAYAIRILQPAG